MIEAVGADGVVLAYIIRGSPPERETMFLTPPDCALQVGYVAYGAGQEIARHLHLPIERRLLGTAEVLIVQRGRCDVDVYTEDRRLVATRELAVGDILVAVGGGHGFRMHEDTLLLEIKQGPFLGDTATKERF